MKEQRFFYTPEPQTGILPDDEAVHAVRVLRLTPGEEIYLMDGKGTFYSAVIDEASKKRCTYHITDTSPQPRQWGGHLHLAMAPTKNIDRTEWFAEKATEIGFDELTFLDCQFSERRMIKDERIEKILVSAMKQSHKPTLPRLNPMTPFDTFINNDITCPKYICHCYSDELPLLRQQLDGQTTGDALVLIGPEGDFSIDEVKRAEAAGFVSVSLGKSRLRTETAALVAVHLMHLHCD
ncbi:MAG: 16S rRNA (uracil(1498)-N(3))-methyltransferase [Prevotellaceae bacterium]|nr:16S rRNA (uracil(1498)-N(3))-methyltransferase [Candidatus Colivivens caballi]